MARGRLIELCIGLPEVDWDEVERFVVEPCRPAAPKRLANSL